MSTGSVPSGTYRAAAIEKAKGKFVLKDLPFRPLTPMEVLVKVEACGVCHSDTFTVDGVYPIDFPRVPGHEVAGEVVALGEKVPATRGLQVGVKVGRGWHGGHCFGCNACMEGDFVLCQSDHITGITDDGGYAEYMYAPWESLALLPSGMPAVTAGPLCCAGVTCFHGLRECKVPPPALVAVLGVGGLGHLAIQFAAKCGYTVAAVTRHAEDEAAAKQYGATHHINSEKEDAAKALQKLGGAAVVIATATSSKAESELVGGIARNGTLLVIGIDTKPLQAQSAELIKAKASIKGHASGTAYDSQQTLQFAAQQRVQVVTEEFPLEKAQEAYDRMLEGKAHYRCVLVPSHKK